MIFKLPVTKGDYRKAEELHALCTLLQWPQGHYANAGEHKFSVTLTGCNRGNTGLSVYLLENNPNATDIFYEDVASLPYQEIFFKVLGVNLYVSFDEDGVGTVTFPIMPVAEAI